MPLHHSCKTDAALDPSALRLPGTHSVRKFLPKFKISSLFQTQLPDHVHVRLQAIADMKPHELTQFANSLLQGSTVQVEL